MQTDPASLIASLDNESATLARYIRAIAVLGRLVTHRAGISAWRWGVVSNYAANQAASIQAQNDARIGQLLAAQLTREQARASVDGYLGADDRRHELLTKAKVATESQRVLIDVFTQAIKERSAAINMTSRPRDVYTLKDLRAPRNRHPSV